MTAARTLPASVPHAGMSHSPDPEFFPPPPKQPLPPAMQPTSPMPDRDHPPGGPHHLPDDPVAIPDEDDLLTRSPQASGRGGTGRTVHP